MGAAIWDKLPEEVVKVGLITVLKRHLDGYMDKKGLEGFEPNTGKWD